MKSCHLQQWMEFEGVKLSETSDKIKYHIISLT